MKVFGRDLVLRPARLATVAALLALAACSGGSAGSSSSAAIVPDSALRTGSAAANVARLPQSFARATTPLLPPTGTIYVGGFINFLNQLPPYETQTQTFETEIGRNIAVHAAYYKWHLASQSFPGAPEIDDIQHHRVPVISWDCGVTSSNVINGSQDAVIDAQAQKFISFKHFVMLRYFWEMNLPYSEEGRTQCVDPARDTGGLFNATDYIAAWQHIHDRFVADGVKNVVWLWCPSGNVQVNPLNYYPTPAYTDWIGFDHYDVTGKVGFQNTLALPYQTLAVLNQPMMVGETGTTPAAQSSYFANAPAIMQTNFPMIQGLMYYNSYGHRQDWRLLSAGVAAFATAAATPYWSGFAAKP